jgi:hypothetical protein
MDVDLNVDLDLVTDVVVVPRVFVDRATKSMAASLVGRSSAVASMTV